MEIQEVSTSLNDEIKNYIELYNYFNNKLQEYVNNSVGLKGDIK